MNKHTQIRLAILADLESMAGETSRCSMVCRHLLNLKTFPALAVWLTDAQYAGVMTDEDDWQAVLHVAVFLKAQAPDAELDTWMEEKIFPALEEVNGSGAPYRYHDPAGL
ncbi:phage minor tail protein U [Salmonella enterica subsp. enterica]|uniref:Phage minor tail protein U n=1 Tax=Salmonella enterica I TaxID=59201 RepID=A0A379WW38_SALET|nr:phage minor tail protein U [Salmonella enterica subsp. enterica]